MIYLAFLGLVLASTGDRLPQFKDCVNRCIDNQCPRDMGLLRLLLWTCEADCDYQCQQFLTAQHLAQKASVHQYHGKWPFIRILGVQEPASVIFSLMNLYANYLGLKLLNECARRSKLEKRFWMYKIFAFVGINTWIWSSVFHIRDFPLTESLDYFSAVGSVFYGLFICICRTFRFDTRAGAAPSLKILAVALLSFYLYHIYYLSFVKFDYAYNMLVGVSAGMLQNILWIANSIRLYNRSGNKMDLLPIALVLAVLLGMSCEVFDFSPFLLTVDAHSLWHLSTVVPTYLWYKWMVYDLTRGREKVE